MLTEFYPVSSKEPSSCFSFHERKAHHVQMNASEFNGCPSNRVSTVKWLQTPFLSNHRAPLTPLILI